MAPIQQATNT